MRTFPMVVERDPETELLVGYVPGWPGAHSQAADAAELEANLREVIEMLLEDGEPLGAEGPLEEGGRRLVRITDDGGSAKIVTGVTEIGARSRSRSDSRWSHIARGSRLPNCWTRR